MSDQDVRGTTMQNTMVIRLRSDLCSGSGDGYSSGVDSDVCYDAKGVPFIPSRRIKGCLRQAARDIGVDTSVTDAIFGVPGSDTPGLLTISDATLQIPSGLTLPADPLDALDLFAYTRAQTKLDPHVGTAEKGTLRYIRVVKHYVPTSDNGLQYEEVTFHARLELRAVRAGEIESELVQYELSRIVRALKNLGMNRNRGLGVVACRLKKEGAWTQVAARDTACDCVHIVRFVQGDGDQKVERVAISYVVRLNGPVMLPQTNSGRSVSYIPGASVQGLLASRISCDDAEFDSMFMSGRTQFSPLYPLDGSGLRCLPAPAFVVKLKGGEHDGKYRNGLFVKPAGDQQDNKREVWAPQDSECVLQLKEGTSFKPLRDGFVGLDWLPKEVVTKVAYHHSTGLTTGDEGTLYMQECLCEGQVFGGYVECDADRESDILNALDAGPLMFGRSKSAQYGNCELVECTHDFSGRECGNTIKLEPDKPYAFVLDSDVALADRCRATITTDPQVLIEALQQATGCDLGHDSLLTKASNLGYRTVGGYNAKWNQKRPQVRVFAAGSTVAFVPNQELDVSKRFTLGEKQAEGFGSVVVVPLEDAHTPSLEAQEKAGDYSRKQTTSQRCQTAALRYAQGCDKTFNNLTPSFLGRASLMVRQSSGERDLRARLDGIRDQNKREAVVGLFDGMLDTIKPDADGKPLEWNVVRECLVLLFRYAKYHGKLGTEDGDNQ